MSGEFLTQTLAAGATMQFQKAGRYFEVIADGGGTFNFTFYGPNGAQSSNWKNCQSGAFIEDPYSAFDVTNNSAGAQAITLLLMDSGRGGSRRQPGVVTITNKISAAVKATSGVGVTSVGGNATQIIAPGSNTNGIVIRRASCSITSGAAGTDSEARMIAAPTVPTQNVPLTSYQIVGAATLAASTTSQDSRNDMNYQLPPGWGIWLYNSIAGGAATATGYELTYELLNA